LAKRSRSLPSVTASERADQHEVATGLRGRDARACWKTTSAREATKCSDAANGSESSAVGRQRAREAQRDRGRESAPSSWAICRSREQGAGQRRIWESCTVAQERTLVTVYHTAALRLCERREAPPESRKRQLEDYLRQGEGRTCLERASSASVALLVRPMLQSERCSRLTRWATRGGRGRRGGRSGDGTRRAETRRGSRRSSAALASG